MENRLKVIGRATEAALALWLLAPSTVFAAEGFGGTLLTIGRFFNLAVVGGVLVWVLRKPLSAFLASRTETIHQQLADAQKARAEAEAKLSEIETRLSRLDAELAELKANAEKEAQEESQRILAETQVDAEKVIERARREIDGMMRTAQVELKSHTAELAVRLAEETIRREISDEDRGRIFGRFVTRLGDKR